MQVYLMNISSNVADGMIQRKTVTLETGLHLAVEQAFNVNSPMTGKLPVMHSCHSYKRLKMSH